MRSQIVTSNEVELRYKTSSLTENGEINFLSAVNNNKALRN